MLLINSRIYGFAYVYMSVLYAYIPFLAQLVNNAKACRISRTCTEIRVHTGVCTRFWVRWIRRVTYFPALFPAGGNREGVCTGRVCVYWEGVCTGTKLSIGGNTWRSPGFAGDVQWKVFHLSLWYVEEPCCDNANRWLDHR